jgi:hypothetical protein
LGGNKTNGLKISLEYKSDLVKKYDYVLLRLHNISGRNLTLTFAELADFVNAIFDFRLYRKTRAKF